MTSAVSCSILVVDDEPSLRKVIRASLAAGGYTVEEVDAITGPLIGLPKSASFRLLDIVGLDIWAFVGTNLHDAVPEDRWRDRGGKE